MSRLVAFILLSAIPLASQSYPTPRPARNVDPIEFSGPPKKLTVLSPTKRAFAQSDAIKHLESKDPAVLASTVSTITSFIQQDPTDADFYLMRAMVSCQMSGSSRESLLNDVATSIKLWKPSDSSPFTSLQGHYGLRAKIEFSLGRYGDALNDLDAGLRIDYDGDDLFENGNAKPDEPITMACQWSHADLAKLENLFPKDYRPPLYRGLYLLSFSRFDLDTDYLPILKVFEKASVLNPSSALPYYFSARPHISGGLGGMLSTANARCVEIDGMPRSQNCLALDDIRRKGVRFLTRAVAVDPSFAPAYAVRAAAYLALREYRQAVRDYTRALELAPDGGLYHDRGVAEVELKEYSAGIRDYTKRIAQGCDAFCPAYENRANLYLKLRNYPLAIQDIGRAIRSHLAATIYAYGIEQFRKMYPEYDDVSDDVLCEKLRVLFHPEMSYADYSRQFLINAEQFDTFVLADLYLKRGDAYADMGDMASANREYDRVSEGFPKWAEHNFETQNGKRVRIRQ